jgi:hypothetical protein
MMIVKLHLALNSDSCEENDSLRFARLAFFSRIYQACASAMISRSRDCGLVSRCREYGVEGVGQRRGGGVSSRHPQIIHAPRFRAKVLEVQGLQYSTSAPLLNALPILVKT